MPESKRLKSTYGNYFSTEDSDYYVDITFPCNKLRFYFSGIYYMNKFSDEWKIFIRTEKTKLENKFNNFYIPDEFFVIGLYKRIEKRGYKITYFIDNKEKRLDITTIYKFYLL